MSCIVLEINVAPFSKASVRDFLFIKTNVVFCELLDVLRLFYVSAFCLCIITVTFCFGGKLSDLLKIEFSVSIYGRVTFSNEIQVFVIGKKLICHICSEYLCTLGRGHELAKNAF